MEAKTAELGDRLDGSSSAFLQNEDEKNLLCNTKPPQFPTDWNEDEPSESGLSPLLSQKQQQQPPSALR